MLVLKIIFFQLQSADHYGTYLGSEATLYSGQKVIVLFLPVSFNKVLSDLDFLKTYKVTLIQQDIVFTVTLASLGNISYLLPCFVL